VPLEVFRSPEKAREYVREERKWKFWFWEILHVIFATKKYIKFATKKVHNLVLRDLGQNGATCT